MDNRMAERLMRININLDRIADALEKNNKLKEKELEFIRYNTELRLKELQDKTVSDIVKCQDSNLIYDEKIKK